jgi:hypothetical protein
MKRVRSVLAAVGLVGVATLAAATGACAGKKNTEILVGVQSDVRIPSDIDTVEVRVLLEGVPIFDTRATVGDGQVSLPGSFGVVAGQDPSRPIVLEVIGYASGAPKVVRRARTTFVTGKTLYLRMPLKFACYAAPDCPDDQTCVAGECKDAAIDASSLPEYTSVTQVAGDRPGAAPDACFEADACFATTTAVQPASSGACTFVTPGDAATAQFTPVLVFPAAAGTPGFCDSSGTCKIALDHDPLEGWEFTDASRASFTLAPGLCTKLALLKGHLEATSVCGEKTPSRPICGPLSGSADPRPLVDESMNLGGQSTFTVDPAAPQHISYTIEIPPQDPQGLRRYGATLTLTSTVPGKKFHATLATTCTDVPPPGAVEASPNGVLTFSWSAQSSTQFAQIVSEEATPFEMQATLAGALQ